MVVLHGPCAQLPAQGCVAGTGRAAAAHGPDGNVVPAFPHSCRGQSRPCAHGAWAQPGPRREVCAPQTICALAARGPCPAVLLPAAACHWYWAPSSVPRCPPLRHSQASSTPAGSHGGTSASGSHPHVCSWRSQFLCPSSGTALRQDWRSERTQPGGCVATSSGRAGDNAVGRLFPGTGSGGRTVPTSWAGGHPRG